MGIAAGIVAVCATEMLLFKAQDNNDYNFNYACKQEKKSQDNQDKKQSV